MKFYQILLVAMLVFTGCAQQNSQNFAQKMDSHIIQSPNLGKWLRLDDLNYAKRSDNLIQFEAYFTNTSSSNRLVSYKVEWKDENGFTQKTIMSKWTKTLVESGRTLSIGGISPSVKSADFVIFLQEPTKDDKKRDDSYHKRYAN